MSDNPTRTMTGKVRAKTKYPWECLPHEIEPGRPVPNDWDKHLFESWADRKARLAAERARG